MRRVPLVILTGFLGSGKTTLLNRLLRRRAERADSPGQRGKLGVIVNELGEVAITDLHNLACPMIRYLNGDLATARDDRPCGCGRTLARIGPIEGRVTETLHDGAGNAVSGLVFNILLSAIGHVVQNFQIVQRADRSIVFKVVPLGGDRMPEREEQLLRNQSARYLPGAPFVLEYVREIPLTPAGKRRVVVVEK